MSNRVNLFGLLGVLVIALSAFGLWKLSNRGTAVFVSRATLAEVQTVHPRLEADGESIRGSRRLHDGSTVKTGPDGRGRLRLDDGTSMVLDRDTELALTSVGARVEAGRLFVRAPGSARTEVAANGIVATLASATAAFDLRDGGTKMFCAAGEVTVRSAKGEESRVHSGETAKVDGERIVIEPEAAFEDWTHGMGAPWSAEGPPRRALGEVWGRVGQLADGDPGSPLTIRASQVDARLAHEMAYTEVRTTYFNAGSSVVIGDFRMAIPRGATVAGFAVERGDAVERGSLAVADRERTTLSPVSAQLEWAGEGWARGVVPHIAPGATFTVVVQYYEWLSPSGGRIQYRYPLVGEGEAPRIGEFFARVDLAGVQPTGVAAGLGAAIDGTTVTLRKSDFVPSSDLVVEATLRPDPRSARGYVGLAAPGDSDDGDYLVLRLEAPVAQEQQGVTLALVLDASGSMAPALLDASRGLVEALLAGLGAQDRLVVFAADQELTPVGPADMGALDETRRAAILAGLHDLSSGGATDLGRALERAADAIPADAPAGMVVYIGDGWPTVGDLDVDRIEARLARRAGGVPRIGAVAVGPLANRFSLGALVRDSGPLLEIADRTDASSVAIALMADALRPAAADVRVVFPPGVDRIYPRGGHAAIAGSTITTVARLKDDMPRSIDLLWRDAEGEKRETLAVKPRSAMDAREIRRRWALARVQELAFQQAGREAATDVAAREGLLSPWTAWVTGSQQRYEPTPLETRVLDLSVSAEAPYAAMLATPTFSFGALADPLNEPELDPAPDADAYRAAVRRAAQRMIDAAGKQFRACRDARAAIRPDIRGTLVFTLSLDPAGTVTQASVAAGDPRDEDAELNRCAETIVRGMRFAVTTLTGTVDVQVHFDLPPPRSMVGRKCSPTSMLPMALRRGIWLERLGRGTEPDHVFLEAKNSCELKTWADRRALLELILSSRPDGLARVQLARRLERAGEQDAADLLRREAMRRARSPRELWAIRIALIGDETLPLAEFRNAYRSASNDEARLNVVRKFLQIAPHHPGLRRRLFALLEAKGDPQALQIEVERALHDPLADATVLADGASALRRAGLEREARRAYGELAERAPHDPSVRAFLGDRLRAEGWAEEATAAYAVLEDLAPNDGATLVRLSLAHAQAARFDLASRMLLRLAQTGGQTGDSQLAELGAQLAAIQVARHLSDNTLSKEDRDRLTRRALDVPWPNPGAVVLVSTPRLFQPIEVQLTRGPRAARELRAPDIHAPSLGIASFRIQPDDRNDLEIDLRRPSALQPEPSVPVEVFVLRADQDLSEPSLAVFRADMAANGQRLILHFDGKRIEPARN